MHQPRKDVLVKKKVDTNEAEEENRLQDVTKKSFIYSKRSDIKSINANIKVGVHTLYVLTNKTRNAPLQQQASMTVHAADLLSPVALEDVLASDIYSCASWDYIQRDLLEYLR